VLSRINSYGWLIVTSEQQQQQQQLAASTLALASCSGCCNLPVAASTAWHAWLDAAAELRARNNSGCRKISPQRALLQQQTQWQAQLLKVL
jgi:hypothetical protein